MWTENMEMLCSTKQGFWGQSDSYHFTHRLSFKRPDYRPCSPEGETAFPQLRLCTVTLQDGPSAILSLSCLHRDLRSLDAARSTNTFKDSARSMAWCWARLMFSLSTDAAVFSKTGPDKPLALLTSCDDPPNGGKGSPASAL